VSSSQLKTIIKSAILEIKDSEMKRLGKISSHTGIRTLRVFDFDDTIAKTNSKVGVTEFNKTTNEQVKDKYQITPAEYAKFKTDIIPFNPNVRYEFDYSEFAEVLDPQIIDWTFNILKKVVAKLHESDNFPAVILTARGHKANKNIRKFLAKYDIHIPVVTLDNSAPELKSNWVKHVMLDRDIPHIEFFDDSVLNVDAVNSLQSDSELIDKFGDTLRIRSRLIK
jgi:hypothetical protein